MEFQIPKIGENHICLTPTVGKRLEIFTKIYNKTRPKYNIKLPEKYDEFAGWLIFCYINKLIELNDDKKTNMQDCINEIYIQYIHERQKLMPNYNYLNKNIKYKIRNTNVFMMEKRCSAIQKLIQKQNLNHDDRMVLCQIYINIPNGSKRLHQILSTHHNYNHNKTQKQIEYAIEKGINAPSCKTLKQKGYCKGGCNL